LGEAQAHRDALHAHLLPSYRLNATEIRQRFSETDFFPPPFGGSTVWRGGVEADISWDIDFWGQQRALIDAATDETHAAALDIESARQALAGSLARVYVNLDRAYALADIAARAEQQRENILKITRQRVEAGLDTNVELRQASGSLPQARVERSQAETAAELAKHELAALAGEGANIYGSVTRPQLKLDEAFALPSELPFDLLARRPDVIAARLRVEGADAARVAAKAAFYPQINLSAFAGFGAIGLDNLFDSRSRIWGIGPSISLPIFKSGRLEAQYRGANSTLDAAIAAYNDTVLNAVRQTADQLTNISALRYQLDEQQQRLDAAEDAYRLVEKRYRAGLASYLSVLTAETQVLDARRLRVDLVAALATARIALIVALGGSFTPDSQLAAATTDSH
jgi:NodT family efflux transporter outer membrane factor (OMF) lipoprotein